ncbi:hypothetical protein L2E82_33063 [Cichorium intybus]|uniref:Uncharacterized protein n=1 Tax=Cichorium intybus TaxID=13427 RepID=A0ACB9BJ62_CICIN|nr:hypothetical protein L2E82_33063 [Cichorium intybus]
MIEEEQRYHRCMVINLMFPKGDYTMSVEEERFREREMIEEEQRYHRCIVINLLFPKGDYTLSVEEERLRERKEKENDGEKGKEKTSG